MVRLHGSSYLEAPGGYYVTRPQRKALRSIAQCRTAALGGHVEECDQCCHRHISYNSCRNRHCPKCQSLARARWLQERKSELLPVEYFHVVFTLPAEIAEVALQNQQQVYGILFQSAAQALRQLAADPEHLGAEIGFIAILHTWGQNLSHHPHIHCVVPGGGLSADCTKWVACREGFLLPVLVLSKLYRRLFLSLLTKEFQSGHLALSGSLEHLNEPEAFYGWITELSEREWVVFSKRPFAGPEQVLEYLGRYTHRVAISNHRLVSVTESGVSFRWKDYRKGGEAQIMTLHPHEFLRRFLQHVLPPGFVRIRHYGFLCNAYRHTKLVKCRELLQAAAVPEPLKPTGDWRTLYEQLVGRPPDLCRACNQGRMHCIEVLERQPMPLWRLISRRLDTS